jgi:hypothetical protein
MLATDADKARNYPFSEWQQLDSLLSSFKAGGGNAEDGKPFPDNGHRRKTFMSLCY